MSKSAIVVDNTIDQEALLGLAALPNVELNVTALDLARLPAEVKADLFTNAASFNAPLLQQSGNIVKAPAGSVAALRGQLAKQPSQQQPGANGPE